MTMQRYAEIGSVSSGTMRPEDLIPAFLNTLHVLDAERAEELDRELHTEILGESELHDDLTDEQQEQIDCFLVDLDHALNEYAPPFHYFGAHCGDGADYGFWFCEDSYHMAVADGEVIQVSDLADLDTIPEDANCVAVVNDHGNITLYAVSDLNTPIWEIV